MPRRARQVYGGEIYHVMNRGNCGTKLFGKDGDYLAFLKLLEEGRRRTGMRILGFCLIPDHWHMILWPKRAEDLAAFIGWVSSTHVRRWRGQSRNAGKGHLYQGRFKSFPIQKGVSLARVLRYVESNARRAQLVKRAEAWPYSSLYAGERRPEHCVELAGGAMRRPGDWVRQVNETIEEAELKRFQLHIHRGRPFGTAAWMAEAVKQMGLESSMRDRGRPRKKRDGE